MSIDITVSLNMAEASRSGVRKRGVVENIKYRGGNKYHEMRENERARRPAEALRIIENARKRCGVYHYANDDGSKRRIYRAAAARSETARRRVLCDVQ